MILTTELKDSNQASKAEVVICMDEEGLSSLIEKLNYLRGKTDHLHLMTPSWAGNELTEVKQGRSEYDLVNHLRLVKI